MAGSIDREGTSRAWRARAGEPYDPPLLRTPAAPSDTTAQRRSLIVKKLHPNQKGTRRLSARFGDHLVCVRYRTDPDSGRRFTTVEIVVEERTPATPAPSHKLIRIGWEETRLRDIVKARGGIWMRNKKLWKVPANAVRELKLSKRVIPESA
ncbi:MAG: hypothetical protein HZC23_10270 [Rhodocyclales bacterium]|nr:hypothetical protein [Rhodocyclales bacterium]